MKYIMFKKPLGVDTTLYTPVIFPNALVHADVAKAMLEGPLEGHTVHSAGEISPLGMECTGGSDTLGVKADPADTNRIQFNDYGMCYE